ncbi:phage tail protein [Acinetobacter brisouii]|uniref:phage tail protein n=1 Tax=Acinetobacter brisouii TaxID=396323 RepID=UPI00124C3673|nr:phage tail protein [Acinetobacter brisouii]
MEAATKKPKVIAGAGGKKSSSSGGSESADTLKSTSALSLIDLLGEGQIGGLVDNSAKSVFLDGTQLMKNDGTYNFESVTWGFVPGTQAQGSLGAGFNTIESVTSVNKKVTNASPFLFTINDPNAEIGRLIMSVNSLLYTDNKGNTGGSSVDFEVDMSINGGSYTKIGGDTISGKTRSHYQRAYSYELPKTDSNGAQAISWTFRVVRVTTDSTSTSTINDLYVDSWASAIETRLTYPNSALFGLSVSAEQFTSIPQRAYLVDGLLIKVPSNRNADGTYTGTWDGTFKLAVCDNPAWILYDLLSAERYGLGQYIPSEYINPARLYEIGRYCDELVDDGFGNQERRFSINTVISSLADAYQLISDISSVFNGMVYWTGNVMGYMADMPADVSMIYNSSNVINGEFNYQGVSRKERHSVALIRYNDPEREYAMQTEYIEDADLIARFGVRKAEITAFGCTTRGQAHRVGRWLLYTEKYQKATISFNVGLDSAFVMPGDVIQIVDPARSGKRNGGRLSAVTATSATLDATVTIDAGSTISIRLEDGTLVTRLISTSTAVSGKTVVLWDAALTTMPVANAVWTISSPNLQPQLARVVGVAQGETAGRFSITALEHNPSKFDHIESDIQLETPTISQVDTTSIDAPATVMITGEKNIDEQGTTRYTLNISWSQVVTAIGYTVKYRKVGGNWIQMPTQTGLSLDIDNIYQGDYEAAVQAISPTNAKSATTYALATTVEGSASILPKIAIITATGVEGAINLNWSFADGTIGAVYTEIQRCLNAYTENPVWDPLTNASYPNDAYTVNGLNTITEQWFRARVIDSFGNASDWSDVTSARPLLNLQSQIDEVTATADAAQQTIDTKMTQVDSDIASSKTDIANLMTSLTNEVTARTSAVNDVVTSVSNEAAARDAAITTKANELSNQIQAQIDTLSNGITSEKQSRTDADNSLTSALNAYKSSNDQSVATVLNKAQSAVDSSSANADQITAISLTLNNKADSSALQTLQSTVNDQGNTITNQGEAITNLQNSLTATNNTVATKADASALVALDSRVTAAEGNITSQTNSLTNLTARVSNTRNYTVKSRPLGATGTAGVVDIDNNNATYGTGRSYAITVFNTDGTFKSHTTYDIFGGGTTASTAFNDAVTALVDGTYVAVTTNDEPLGSLSAIRSSLLLLGATDAALNQITYRSAYLLIGRKGAAQGQGLEIVSPSANTAGIDYALTMVKGVPNGVGGTGGLANAVNTLNSTVTSIDGRVTSNTGNITSLQNSVSTINGTLATKADTSAVNSLSSRVAATESGITVNTSDITTLKGTVNNPTTGVTATANSLATLQNTVTSQGNTISSQASSVTSLQAGLKAANAASGDLIPNPSFDPTYSQMGYTVIASTDSSVPTGCPYPYVAKLAGRDHAPTINNIPCKPGDVFELSVLMACSTGTATFGHYIYKSTSATGGDIALISGPRISATTTWTRSVWRWTAPSGVYFFKPFLQIEQNSPFGTIWFATDWHCLNITAANTAQVASDANTTAIGTLNTSVTNINGQVTANSNAITNLTATVNNKADASVLSNYYTTTQADSAIASAMTSINSKLVARPNLCPGLSAWTFGAAFTLDSATDWGERLTTQTNGTLVATSPMISVRPNGTYVLTYDSLRLATSGNVYADLQGYDSTGAVVWDSSQNSRSDSHDFSTSNSNRDTNAIALTIPANVVNVKVRFVSEGITGITSCGIRQVKLEYGNLPASMYTAEAQLNYNSTTITNTSKVVNGISALNAVYIDNNGVMAGYALNSDLVNGKVTSAFGVNVDTFYVGNPTNGQKVFTISNGKVVMNTALIGSLDAGKITTGTLNSNLIAANSITADKLSVDSLSALSANLGTFTSSTSQGTTIISGSAIEIKDANGVTRVKLGVF